jgi:putative transposase
LIRSSSIVLTLFSGLGVSSNAFPEKHWRRTRTNNPLERILREFRRRTRVVGAFPDGQSALNLAAARLRHIAGTARSTKRYLNIELLKDQQMGGASRVSQDRV